MTVSILLPAYNASKFLEAALDSIRAQTYSDYELIAIDDGSSDDTREILQRRAMIDPRIRVISHKNIGMGASLNLGLRAAKHDWIVRMDADDVMAFDRIEKQKNFVERNPEISIAASYVKYINDRGDYIGRGLSPLTTLEKVRERVASGHLIGFHHPSVMARKDVLLEVGGYRSEFWPADDIDLWNRVVENGYEVLVQPEFLLEYRIHEASVTVARTSETRKKVGWVKACMKARQSGHSEPSWQEYIDRSASNFLSRANFYRKDAAAVIYKKSAINYSLGNYCKPIFMILFVFFLRPFNTIMKVKYVRVNL